MPRWRYAGKPETDDGSFSWRRMQGRDPPLDGQGRKALPGKVGRRSECGAGTWWDCTIISSPSPVAAHREAATREAMRCRGSVIMGHPPHSTSHPVVCALHSGVSRNTSATPARPAPAPPRSPLHRAEPMLRLAVWYCKCACTDYFVPLQVPVSNRPKDRQ